MLKIRLGSVLVFTNENSVGVVNKITRKGITVNTTIFHLQDMESMLVSGEVVVKDL